MEPLRNALGSLSTIFAHFDECGPYPWSKESKKNKLRGLKLAVCVDKAIEIRQFGVERIAYALDGVERDAAHGGEAGDRGSFHVDQGGLVGGCKTALFGLVGDTGTGGKPEFARAGVAVEAFAGAGVYDSGAVVGGAGGNVGGEGAGPADGDDEVDGAAIFNCGEGASGGVEAGSSAGGDPVFFFVRWAQKWMVPRVEWGQLRTRGLSSPGMAAIMATRVMAALPIRMRAFPPLLRKDGAPGLRGASGPSKQLQSCMALCATRDHENRVGSCFPTLAAQGWGTQF